MLDMRSRPSMLKRTERLVARVLLFSLLMLVRGFGGEAQSAAFATNAGPRIQFSEPAFDFGKVSFGTVVQHDYIFTNTGDQLLVIKDVHPACGCTTVRNWSREIAPGKAGTISINFETANISGPVAKSIMVAC